MAGVRRKRWDGPPLPVTDLLGLYRELRNAPQKDRVVQAETFAGTPADLARLFDHSVEVFSAYENPEAFYPNNHEPRAPLASGEAIVHGRDVGRALTVADADDPFFKVEGINDLELRLVDYEVEPTRTTGGARFADGKKATQGMTLDLLMCDRAGVPAVCEVKTRGDMDPFFALVQALACTAHLATAPQTDRLRRWFPDLRFGDGRFDVLVIGVKPAVARPARYQARFRAAAIQIAEELVEYDAIRQHICHLAVIDLTQTGSSVLLAKAAS